MHRRRVLEACALTGSLTSTAAALAAAPAEFKRYGRTLLTDASGAPLRATDLPVGGCHVFSYPYLATPCFLLNLGRPLAPRPALETADGRTYVWPGGVGPARSIVAFSAICAHKLSHPTRTVSFISYRSDPVRFRNRKRKLDMKRDIIFCCSEKSAYDPTAGAEVLGGPARQPLAAIALEHDAERDRLHAVGSAGGEMFDAFFAAFTPRLQLEMATTEVRARVGKASETVPFEQYSSTTIPCG